MFFKEYSVTSCPWRWFFYIQSFRSRFETNSLPGVICVAVQNSMQHTYFSNIHSRVWLSFLNLLQRSITHFSFSSKGLGNVILYISFTAFIIPKFTPLFALIRPQNPCFITPYQRITSSVSSIELFPPCRCIGDNTHTKRTWYSFRNPLSLDRLLRDDHLFLSYLISY